MVKSEEGPGPSPEEIGETPKTAEELREGEHAETVFEHQIVWLDDGSDDDLVLRMDRLSLEGWERTGISLGPKKEIYQRVVQKDRLPVYREEVNERVREREEAVEKKKQESTASNQAHQEALDRGEGPWPSDGIQRRPGESLEEHQNRKDRQSKARQLPAVEGEDGPMSPKEGEDSREYAARLDRLVEARFAAAAEATGA